ncbi:type 1 glutamine amidotransferase [Flavihumibacter profundi]|uniref:type 1 glutamine amidotransferase n=1 Tax=Flavihumibacter profundi TaxID=2716883 RepID=UPI001CC7F2C5|nr:GMP synthase [Flavihumibacter profundi]MBZ5856715.1 GMP synthase [Flavihumibacter profundi]
MEGANKMIRVAILDLYEGVENQGMRCIREILNLYSAENQLDLHWDEFEVRIQKKVPDLSYDLYISSGGPGSPLDSEGSEWEKVYFDWLSSVEAYNQRSIDHRKKYVFFICHSYQLACRHYKVGKVAKRKSTAFGVFPIHMLPGAQKEVVFQNLKDPFYSVDSRDYQVIEPDHSLIRQMGAKILAIEKERPHVPFERAMMAIRFNDFMVGTQFHPEADPVGMSMYLQREDKKKTVIDNHGAAKWASMIEHLNDPDKIRWTYSQVLPNFITDSISKLREN